MARPQAALSGGYQSAGGLTSQTNAAVDHLFGFTGRERDEESDLLYYRARYSDPQLGQFTGEDPIGFEAGDANLRRYVGNNATNAVDPSGLDDEQGPPTPNLRYRHALASEEPRAIAQRLIPILSIDEALVFHGSGTAASRSLPARRTPGHCAYPGSPARGARAACASARQTTPHRQLP